MSIPGSTAASPTSNVSVAVPKELKCIAWPVKTATFDRNELMMSMYQQREWLVQKYGTPIDLSNSFFQGSHCYLEALTNVFGVNITDPWYTSVSSTSGKSRYVSAIITAHLAGLLAVFDQSGDRFIHVMLEDEMEKTDHYVVFAFPAVCDKDYVQHRQLTPPLFT